MTFHMLPASAYSFNMAGSYMYALSLWSKTLNCKKDSEWLKRLVGEWLKRWVEAQHNIQVVRCFMIGQ